MKMDIPLKTEDFDLLKLTADSLEIPVERYIAEAARRQASRDFLLFRSHPPLHEPNWRHIEGNAAEAVFKGTRMNVFGFVANFDFKTSTPKDWAKTYGIELRAGQEAFEFVSWYRKQYAAWLRTIEEDEE